MTKYIVQVIERERGFMPKSIKIKEFKTLKSAQKFADKINSKNTSPTTPYYYIQAEIIGITN